MSKRNNKRIKLQKELDKLNKYRKRLSKRLDSDLDESDVSNTMMKIRDNDNERMGLYRLNHN
ncbi:hypothetical protein ACFLS9_01255 [Bacteroidota bacterium]